jgi:hypothetical protein
MSFIITSQQTDILRSELEKLANCFWRLFDSTSMYDFPLCLAKFGIAARRFCISHAVGAIASSLWLSADSPLQHPPTRRSSSDGLLGSHFAQMSFRRFDHVDPSATLRKDCATQAPETIINPHFAAPQRASHRFFFGRATLGELDKLRIM